MTIDISDLINTPLDKFEEKLEAFKKLHPPLFMERTTMPKHKPKKKPAPGKPPKK